MTGRSMSVDPREEARRICALFGDKPADLVSFLSGQLSVLKSQAHMLVGLCGLAITVTGFSGAHMIRAGTVSALSMICGIGLIVVGLLVCLRTLARMRWVTQDLHEDLVETATTVITRRNAEQLNLLISSTFVAAGLVAYLVAVVLAAWLVGAS